MKAIRTISPTTARRLFIAQQRLAGARPPSNAAGIMEVVRDLGCLQLDPISAVARSHMLVLWSRLGPYDRAHLDTLMWQERKLFEYWAHAASIVLTEDYAIHNLRMRRYGKADTTWNQRIRAWMEKNDALRRHIKTELRRNGPLPSRALQEQGLHPLNWVSSGWTSERNISRMLDFLWMKGEIMVASRVGGQKLWDLCTRVLPEWTPRERLSERQVVYRAAQKSLRALGVGSARDIALHYISGRYPNLAATLERLEAEEGITRVQIRDEDGVWPGAWYVHADVLPLLDHLEQGEFEPRTTLLSPFDNLIINRQRTERFFNFHFRIEIYVPKHLRQYGYYVLSILDGDRLIGRVDPLMNRARGQLTINAVHAEKEAPMNHKTARAVADAIEELATFLGAQEIIYSKRVPSAWARALH